METAGTPDCGASIFVVVDAVYPEVVQAILRQASGFFMVLIYEDEALKVKQVVAHFTEKQRQTGKRYLLGFSLSACLCERLSADPKTSFDAGCSISSLMDVSKSHHKLDENSGYRRQHLERTKHNDRRRPRELRVENIHYVQEYDFRVVCKSRNIKYLDEYYDSISGVEFWKDIRIPYLFIMSYCDPIVE